MPTAILIGFEYTFNSLTGAIIDLYHAYKWCKSFDCDIHIFTDINHIKDPNNLQNVVERKIADSGLLTFYDNIKSKTIVNNGSTLLNKIINILTMDIPDNKLVIYYSGHGVKDSMVMPDRTLLPFVDFRDNILQVLYPYVEIFWILDCCNPNGLHLPYKLEGNTFILSPTKIECISQPILLITSSEANEKSIATKAGSVFSRHLFRILTLLNSEQEQPITISRKPSGRYRINIPTHKNRNLRRLIGNLASSIRKMHTGYAQTVSVYSSYVIDPILWMWVGSCKHYDIVTDISLSSLIIRNISHSERLNNNLITFAECNYTGQTTNATIDRRRNIQISTPSLELPSYMSNTRDFDQSSSQPNKLLTQINMTNPYDLLYPEY